ncbi:hypothetical protein OQA88_7695 [Cercophora sp. LCS_1]
MQFSTLLALALSLSTAANALSGRGTIQKRDCYKEGVVWGNDKAFALNAIADACNDPNFAERYYTANSGWIVCKDLPNNRRVDYKIYANKARWVNRGECNEYLRFEVDGCPQGGERTWYDVVFSADPGQGSCANPETD